MKKIISLFAMVAMLSCFCVNVFALEAATIVLNGASTIELDKGMPYSELEATASYTYKDKNGVTKTKDISDKIIKSGSVDYNTVGEYTITYKVLDTAEYAAASITRIVKVIDPSETPSPSPSETASEEPTPTTSPTDTASISPEASPTETASVSPDVTPIKDPVDVKSCKPKADMQNNNVSIDHVAGDVNITNVKVTNNIFVKGSLFIDYNCKKIKLDDKAKISWAGSKKITTNQNAFTLVGTDANGKVIKKTIQLEKGTHDYKVELKGDNGESANVEVNATYEENANAEPIPIVTDESVGIEKLPQTGESSNTGLLVGGCAIILFGLGALGYFRFKGMLGK